MSQAGLLVAAAVAWSALLGMGTSASDAPLHWGVARLAPTLAMWGVMMVAMMAPTLLPTLQLFARVTDARREGSVGGAAVSPAFFASGYLLAWLGFSALATGLQWALDRGAALSADGALESRIAAGVVLCFAGLYQLTPLKDACLRQCQSPLGFLLSHWREGAPGALGLGFRHGVFCVGCCWALMLLMFVGGTMSLGWMAGLTLYVIAEKLAGRFTWLSSATGAALGLVGLGMLLTGILGRAGG